MKFFKKNNIPFINKVLFRINYIVHGCAISPTTVFGSNVKLNHGGLGICIHERAVIGSNVNIGHYVTIGGSAGRDGVPVVEDNVFIASRAMVLGDVRVGQFSIVGANSVVTKDVPPFTVVGGVPAKKLADVKKNITTAEIMRGVYK